jgi:hypothetical protein
VRPEAGDGDKRTESRSRWKYDPDGDPLTDPVVAPPGMNHPGEKAVPRTNLTTRERKLIEALYRRLHE